MKISFRMDKHDWDKIEEILEDYYRFEVNLAYDNEEYLRSEEYIADKKAHRERIISKIDDIVEKYGYTPGYEYSEFIDDFEEMCKIENERRGILDNILELYSGSEISTERMSKMLKLEDEQELEEWLVYLPRRIHFRKEGSNILIPKLHEE